MAPHQQFREISLATLGLDLQGRNVERAGARQPPCAKLPQRLLKNARLLPDRLDALPLLPKGGAVVEVGVAAGDFSEYLLRVCEPSLFIAIDIFNLHEMPTLWGRPTREWFRNLPHGAFYRERFAEPLRAGRMRVLEGDSAAMLATLQDKSVDIVYLDADHSYQSVSRELAIIRRKIKDDGIIIANDYVMNEVALSAEPYGVIQAVNEFMLAENWEMIYFALQNYMYCDVVLRKVRPEADGAPDLPRPVDFSAFLALEKECLALRHALAQKNAPLQREIDELRAALGAMRASKSWRATAPLRAALRLLRGGR